MRKKWYLVIIFLLSFVWLNQASIQADQHDTSSSIYVVPVEDDVEQGLASFLERSINEAEESFADLIVFEIDSPGGRVDSANDIANLITSADIPTVAYIINQAASAGSYIALNADEIYFQPNGRMGAAGVINSDGTAADSKAQSDWIKAMRASAEANDRDPLYAEAMANSDIDLPDLGAPEGEFLTLSPQEAVEVGYAEGIAEDRRQLFEQLEISNPQVTEMELTISEQIARFITNPVVIPILLSIASIGLIVELYSPGFGIPGILGLVSLILFFYGHLVAGLAGYESVILLLVGLICIILEIFVPSGILGIIGAGAILGALLVSGADMGHMAFSVGIALLVSIILSIVLFRKLDFNKGILRHIVLSDATKSEYGYVSNENRMDLIGLKGRALTFLRPSGTAVFNGERLDVVTEGSFINRDAEVEIVKVEGSRIVVREIQK
ncbi:NfeD family protein [Aquisalibacillus elongatus]|uniref:Membrane-bound serine protease (ClpP class) n=1 Tax=Aquisalibacillus elongatus TaxID=485577 RepID=A0A3N5BK01_9BACI|nr:nodulation protein NfeD [Aquisalibacillus elongatus]RPF55590.1 membrane-bound serine protease (ClpP class) [Aquisalibacillus elongatus]